uniref:Immunoglobulin-binding protein 1 (Trinotate prediction) n=1 Tax=Myxobolus squamalis TaxID=59785 RepID=A0A6B2G6I1_MYXSQ
MSDEGSCVSFKSLFDIFYTDYKKKLENSNITDRDENQKTIEGIIEEGRKIYLMVQELSLFSVNEDFEELPTSSIRYLALPGLIGNLFMHKQNDRINSLNEAQKFYRLFFSYVINYHIFDDKTIQRINDIFEENSSCKDAFQNRQNKIEIFKQKKEIEETIKILQDLIKSRPDIDVADTHREIYILQLSLLVEECISNLSSSIVEIKLLLYKASHPTVEKDIKSEFNNDKKFSFIRLNNMDKVFGAGYPSQPTMTSDEYLLHEMKTGKIVTQYQSKTNTKKDESKSSDEEDLSKQRKWDEFKDNHRRGSGNRHNHG